MFPRGQSWRTMNMLTTVEIIRSIHVVNLLQITWQLSLISSCRSFLLKRGDYGKWMSSWQLHRVHLWIIHQLWSGEKERVICHGFHLGNHFPKRVASLFQYLSGEKCLEPGPLLAANTHQRSDRPNRFKETYVMKRWFFKCSIIIYSIQSL